MIPPTNALNAMRVSGRNMTLAAVPNTEIVAHHTRRYSSMPEPMTT